MRSLAFYVDRPMIVTHTSRLGRQATIIDNYRPFGIIGPSDDPRAVAIVPRRIEPGWYVVDGVLPEPATPDEVAHAQRRAAP